MTTPNASRRHFLRHAGALATLGGGAPLALNLSLINAAAAQAAGDYRALVCVFLRGGNDNFNTVLATDAPSWQAYNAVRANAGDQTVGLRPAGTPPQSSAEAGSPARLGGVLPIHPLNAQGRSYALHPCLTQLQRLFNDERRLAVVANVGPLIGPTTKADIVRGTAPLPPKLFSHNDQQSVWQSMGPEGTSTGWGGRMGDLLAAANGQAMFTSISTMGKALWVAGRQVQPLSVTSTGLTPFGGESDNSVYGSPEIAAAVRRIGAAARTANMMEADYAVVAQRSVQAGSALRAALPPAGDSRWAGTGAAGSTASLRYVSPASLSAQDNPLAQQLQTVARVIAASASGRLAVRRQVFFVALDGFDTHDSQNAGHADLMAQLDHGLAYFDQVMGNLGLRQNVTLFTASDFGRTFTCNGDGTDHGWGGHHFVMGGAVRGRDLYGRFPTLGPKNPGNAFFDSSADQLRNGVLLPALGVDQFAASLGRWFGLSDGQLTEVLPNLARFSQRDVPGLIV